MVLRVPLWCKIWESLGYVNFLRDGKHVVASGFNNRIKLAMTPNSGHALKRYSKFVPGMDGFQCRANQSLVDFSYHC